MLREIRVNSKEFSKLRMKIVVMGDGNVGKTSLLVRFKDGVFPEEYVPEKEFDYKNITFTLQLWDTAGQEEFAKLRRMSYPDTDCFVITFSLVDRTSFENSYNQWYKDLLRNKVGDTPILLVGTKSDLRKDLMFVDTEESPEKDEEEDKEKNEPSTDPVPVDLEEIDDLLDRMDSAFKFVPTSALNGYNVQTVFEEVVKYCGVPVNKRPKSKREKKKKKKFKKIKKKKPKPVGGEKKKSKGIFSSISKDLNEELAGMNYLPDDDGDD